MCFLGLHNVDGAVLLYYVIMSGYSGAINLRCTVFGFDKLRTKVL